MTGARFINTGSSGRGGGSAQYAKELAKIEQQKKGKLDAKFRYNYIFKKRLEASRQQAKGGGGGFRLPGSSAPVRQVSKRTEQAMKEMAARKAAKEAKALRQMVIIQPRGLSNGAIRKNGDIADIAGNIIGKINKKDGRMATTGGWAIGKYKPKSMMTNMNIQAAIDKYSPYYINLRKMQAMQQGHSMQGLDAYEVGHRADPIVEPIIDHHAAMLGFGHGEGGRDAYGYNTGGGLFQDYGEDPTGPRQNVGATAWGAIADNTWGVFADNVWGTSADTVWGTNLSDVWGGVGVSSAWGNHAKTVNMWGTGNGHNYLKGLANRVAAFFGLNLRIGSVGEMHEALRRRRSGGVGHMSGGSTMRAGVEHAMLRRGGGSGGGTHGSGGGTIRSGGGVEHAVRTAAHSSRK